MNRNCGHARGATRRPLQVVVVLAFLFGFLQIPTHATISVGSLTLVEVKARVFTPNGDGYNDKVRFEMDNPEDLPVSGQVFDISGARVADLTTGSDPAHLLSILLWDGKDTDGKVVAGGMYIYQIEFQGKHATGTVVVAR